QARRNSHIVLHEEHVAAIAKQTLLERARLERVGHTEQEISEARAGELAVEVEDASRLRRADDVGLNRAKVGADLDRLAAGHDREIVERLERPADLVVREERALAKRDVSERAAEGEPRQPRHRLRHPDTEAELLVHELVDQWLFVDREAVVAEP